MERFWILRTLLYNVVIFGTTASKFEWCRYIDEVTYVMESQYNSDVVVFERWAQMRSSAAMHMQVGPLSSTGVAAYGHFVCGRCIWSGFLEKEESLQTPRNG